MTTTTATAETNRPVVTFRLPKPGSSDQFFGFSRSYYYRGEELGYWRLIRIRDEGKQRGITLVPHAQVAAFLKRQMEAQDGGDTKPQFESSPEEDAGVRTTSSGESEQNRKK